MVLSATMPPLSPTRSPAADVDTDTTTDTGADAVVAAGSAGSANASVATRHRRRGRLAAIAILVALIAVGAPLSLALGSRSVPLDVVWDSMRHLRELLARPDSLNADQLAVVQLRFPRTLLAVLVGAALGVAGALIQGHTRNPLADPGILGISSGAALAVVAGLALGGISGTLPSAGLAFCGAALATVAIFGLSSIGSGQVNPLTLILAGAALSAVLNAITSAFVLTDNQNLDYMRFWTVGSVAGRDLHVFWAVLPVLAVALAAALACGPTLNVLTMGEESASALGVNVGRSRIIAMLLIALLAGTATAAAGPIGFIGLVIPHIARSITGPDYRWILPVSALAGAALLVYADIVGRLIARPAEVQVGIVLAFVGAPFFMFLIYRNRVVNV